MTGIELKATLSNYSYPLPASQRAGIFALYHQVTGTPKKNTCPNCANDAYIELSIIAKNTGENQLPLVKINGMKNEKASTMTKYSIDKPFRVHGDPKIYANWNTTDQEVEMLINRNNALRHHFTRLDGGDILQFQNPVKVVKTSENSTNHSVEVEAESEPIPVKRGRKKK